LRKALEFLVSDNFVNAFHGQGENRG
jgi:hypothetical protein